MCHLVYVCVYTQYYCAVKYVYTHAFSRRSTSASMCIHIFLPLASYLLPLIAHFTKYLNIDDSCIKKYFRLFIYARSHR